MIRQLILFLLSSLCLILGLEVFVRLAGISSPSIREFYDDIGRGTKSNVDYIYFSEGFGMGNINKFRYIGEENEPKKSSNTIRIAVLGDSFVESFQIFERDHFGQHAEAYLSKKFPNKRIEFLNFGRSGFDIGDMYVYHKLFSSTFNPDLTIFMLSKDDLQVKSSDKLRPRLDSTTDSLIIRFDYPAQTLKLFNWGKFFTQNSVLVNLLYNCVKRAKKRPPYGILFGKFYYSVYPKNTSQLIKKKPVELAKKTRMIIQNLDPSSTIIINRDTIGLGKPLEELCKKRDLSSFSLVEDFRRMKDIGINPTYWPATGRVGHWNQPTHRVVGESVAEYTYQFLSEKTEKNR